MEDILKFKKDFKTGHIICFPLGRLILASGNVIRLHYSPTGLKIGLEKESLNNGDVTLFDSSKFAPGLKRELNLYKQALTKAVSLPKGVLPDTKDWYTVMLNGSCIVKRV